MFKRLISLVLIFHSTLVSAGVLDVFRQEDGHTNWQYVANFSSFVFISALTLTVLRLFFSRREIRRYNRELEAIRSELEQRVRERTATLNESNRLLTESNALLEGEISQHRETTTLLRSSEAYINNILRSMPLMLIGLNTQMQITQWNRGAEEITGISSDAALGQDLWETYPVITILPQQIQQVLDQKTSLTLKQSQRGHYHFDVTIYPLTEQIESGVVILIDDVTQRIQTENKLIQRDKMSSMGELAATMAHDINTPLQVITRDIESVLAEIKDVEGTSDKPSSRLRDALEQGQHASAVIANLLDFASAQAAEKRMASVTEIIDRALLLAQEVIAEPNGLRFGDITIERRYADELPKTPCYISELQQVFLSLFRHACHALGEVSDSAEDPRITVEVNEFYDSLWVKVSHNGRGLSYEDQQSIFEPFFDNSGPESDYDISKRLSFSHFIITDQHHGEMAVTSDIELGTTFHMQLQLNHQGHGVPREAPGDTSLLSS